MDTVAFKYDIGDILRDKVTGLQGVVIVRAEYASRSRSYGIQPREIQNNTVPEYTWLDETTLELVESDVVDFGFEKLKSGWWHPWF